MTDTLDPSTSDPTMRIDEATGNKIITFECDGEMLEFIIGRSPEGTDIWQRVPYDAGDYGTVADYRTDFDHADPA